MAGDWEREKEAKPACEIVGHYEDVRLGDVRVVCACGASWTYRAGGDDHIQDHLNYGQKQRARID